VSLFKKEAPSEPSPRTAGGQPQSSTLSLGEDMRVSAVNYTVVKNSLVHLEWTREGNDYVYQWKMNKASHLSEQAVLARLVAATDDVLPTDTHVFFDKPMQELQFPFFTIRVKDIAERPGAKQACEEKLVDVLLKLNVWA